MRSFFSHILIIKYLLFFSIVFFSTTSYTQSYFPPISGNSWDTLSPSNLNWCQENIDTLINFLEMTNTKSFIILKDGKIVLENYLNGHSDTTYWYWASAAKSLMAVIVGKAQEEGYLNIEDSTSTYIGSGWTSCSSSQERDIKIKHQLMMTTGINDIGVDLDCIDDTCLFFLDTPNNRWAYHNAPYLLLRDVVESATGQGINMYINQKLNTQIGMFGFFGVNNTNLFYSNTRSMARFGLLVLNQGKWNGSSILNDSIYFNQMINTSQPLNESYGYLWWLNGKNSHMQPRIQFTFNGSLNSNAPTDMISALGKNGQIINIVPSKNMVIVRMGNDPDTNSFISATYNNQLWDYINKLECSSTNTNSVNSKYKKKVIRIIDPVGRNTSNSNILFYIYSDGTIEKKIILK